jgi:hypothetical protein
MGWKLAGIAMSESYENRFADLSTLLDLDDFTFDQASQFEEQRLGFVEDDEFVIGFFGTGTLLFCGTTLMTNDALLQRASVTGKVLAFYVYDTTSTYCFDYFENGRKLITKWVSYCDKNIDSSANFGVIPPTCKVEDDGETIFNMIGYVLGKHFYKIGEEEPVSCYKRN